MKNEIILNNEPYLIKESDLPYLVIYGDKSGGSHFTISLMKDLYLSGSKLLFFTAFPMARDNFLEQIGSNHSTVAFMNKTEDLNNYKDSQALILDSGNEELFIEAINSLGDINERVILVKNIEAFSKKVFNSCLSFDKIILSGHIDTCVSKDEILNKKYQSTVVFTKPEIALDFEVPNLEKWTGFLQSESKTGMIKVQI